MGSEMCIRDSAGPGWASPEKRSRPAHGWKGRPRSWQRSARWYQAFCFFFAGTRRSLVPHTKTKTIFFHTKTKISRTHTDTDGFFFWDVSIRNSLRSNNIDSSININWLAGRRRRTQRPGERHGSGRHTKHKASQG